MEPTAEAIALFWSKVDKSGDCWEWTGALNQHGYGLFFGVKGLQTAHRAGFVIQIGPIPRGASILHHCDHRRCVRGDHLYAGSTRDNARDARERNRFKRCCHPRQLTPEQLATIAIWKAARRELGLPQQKLAIALGVGHVYVAQIETGVVKPSARLNERLAGLLGRPLETIGTR